MATYKIPSVIPNIKAARITASRDPYTNPQINVNKSFTAFSQGVQQGIKNGMIQRNNTKNYRAQEKAAQERRYAQQFKLADNFAIENFETDTGSAQFDAGVENWLYKLKDNYIAISNGMLEHPDTYAYGSSQLNKITNQVKTWQAVQPKLLEYIVDYKASLGIKPGDENSVSDTTPEALQTMIMGMLQGGPQVNLVEDDKGELNVYMAPQVFTNNLGEKEETNGYSLRLSGLLNDNLTGNDMIHYVPEYLKMATSAANELILGKSEGGTDNQVYTELFQEPIEGLDNQSGTYTRWKNTIPDANGGLQRHQKFLKVAGQEEEYKNPFYVADENDPSIGALINGKDLAELNFLQLDTFDNISHSRIPGDNDAMILWTVKGLGNGEEWTGSSDQVMAVNAFMATTATDEYQTKNGLRTTEQTGGIRGKLYKTNEFINTPEWLAKIRKENEDTKQWFEYHEKRKANMYPTIGVGKGEDTKYDKNENYKENPLELFGTKALAGGGKILNVQWGTIAEKKLDFNFQDILKLDEEGKPVARKGEDLLKKNDILEIIYRTDKTVTSNPKVLDKGKGVPIYDPRGDSVNIGGVPTPIIVERKEEMDEILNVSFDMSTESGRDEFDAWMIQNDPSLTPAQVKKYLKIVERR